ncbi:hypothetical protein GCM10023219_03530 [Stakelama sediminis]|uniref:Uncharacterized protein n=1 Tax=Stakelama sediminis TaxID=463200 RepID=A0A840YZQ1_9SPHN|nr:hypothetical protein [Stakelama sediminis]MBB5719017.1 hypothetical protein [Stakelama sediminis]
MQEAGVIERAFQLARGNECSSLKDIRRTLAREGYEGVEMHLLSPTLRSQLRREMTAAARRESV